MSMMHPLWPLVLTSLMLAPSVGCTAATTSSSRSWLNPWSTPAPLATTTATAAPATAAGQPSGVKPVNFEEEQSIPKDVSPDKGPIQRWFEDNTRWITGAKRRAPTEAERRKAQALFDEAEGIFRQTSNLQGDARSAKFAEAGPKYGDAAYLWPDSAVEENGLFGVGECGFFSDQYDAAELAYEALVKAYPNTRHIDTVSRRRFAIAQFWLALHEKEQRWSLSPNWTDKKQPQFDTFGHAVKTLERIRLDDPAGKLADDATLLAGNAQYKCGNFLEADEFYSDLRRNFPDSEHQFKAHILGLQCKFQVYQGPDYDQSPLVEAEKLIKTIRRQFPQESEKELKFLEESFKEVRKRKAIAEWQLAQYYDSRAEYRAAKHHYDRVAKDFSDTSLADAARQRVTEIAGLPPVPENRFAWLTDRFSKQEDDKSSYGSGPAPTKLR